MQKLALALLSLLLVSAVQAQPVTGPAPVGIAGAYNAVAPTCTTGNFCYLQLDVNGKLLTAATITPSGTQDINIKQVQGAVPSLTNPLWITPATGAVFPVTLPVTPLVASGNGTIPVPSAETAAGTSTTASTVLAANLVVKASAGNLYSFNVSADSTLSAAAWWVMIYNATSAPVDGTVTPAKCYAMPLGATSYSAAFTIPVNFSTGITIGVSTNGCFTKAASTHAFISGDFK